jgi:hypothetical protein
MKMKSASMQCNYFQGQGKSKHSRGPYNEKARHVSAAGSLFITQ